jgi:hypothetical protein
MKQIQTSGYTFVPASRQITSSVFSTVGLGRVLLVNNATRGVVIFDPSATATNGTLSGSTLTLTFDTTTHSSGDTLTIFYDDSYPATYVDAYGEFQECLESLRFAIASLTRTIGMMQPDASARMRIALDTITAGVTLPTVTTVGTVTTCSTLTNQSQLGGVSANDQVPALMHLSADNLRANIVTT